MKPIEAYFGADASKYPSQSPTPGLLKSKIPLLVAFAGLDPPAIEQQSIDLVEALCKAQRCPRKVFLQTHSHMSIGAAIGTKDVELTNQILAIRAGRKIAIHRHRRSSVCSPFQVTARRSPFMASLIACRTIRPAPFEQRPSM